MALSELPFNYQVFLNELSLREIDYHLIEGTDIIEAKYGNQTEWFLPSHHRLVPSHYQHFFSDKYYTKKILAHKNFPVAEGKIFHKQDLPAALNYVQTTLLFPVVIKAPNLSSGDGIFLNITSEEEFMTIWRNHIQSSVYSYYIVEKYFCFTEDYTFFVMENYTCPVFKRSPPTILGDGIHTLRQLVEQENEKRTNPRTTCLGDIYLDDPEGKRALRKQKLHLDDVIEKDRQVQLRFNSNISYGGTCENVTDLVHPSYKEMALELLRLFPGLPYLLIDLFSQDITSPAQEGKFFINELETSISISMFTMPSKGDGVNILTPILDKLFPSSKLLE